MLCRCRAPDVALCSRAISTARGAVGSTHSPTGWIAGALAASATQSALLNEMVLLIGVLLRVRLGVVVGVRVRVVG